MALRPRDYDRLTYAVPDLETAVAEIGSRGIDPGPFILVGPDGAAGRKAPFVDLDGNSIFVIEIAEG